MSDGRSKRYNSGKPRMDLIPLDLLVGLARVLEYGESKYPDPDGYQNWRRGAPAKEQISSLLRHLSPIMEHLHTPHLDSSVLYDSESLLPHVDHMLFNCISLRLALEQEYDLQRDPVR
jgi:hypothetical protein